ncbi:protein S-acyltransferase [Malassezia vespertilionis]|uniref:protein S-acyltransferase n=1 Tax=Malassezia vespertilionis TaxID=2020962 RepID=UPI0024B0BD45|nr:protein S-acyltransferase [Malassezia vespertilionis]WFD05940.1 protein S-acyltransferase [Malassezia vespertilionis]
MHESGFSDDKFDEARSFDNRIYADVAFMGNMQPDTETGDGNGKSTAKNGRFPWSNPDLLQRQINSRQQGIGRQRYPIVSWILAVGVLAAFIAELILSKQKTGQAVQTKPHLQPMIGPPPEFLISFGARFVPCMRKIPGLSVNNELPCLEYTTSDSQFFKPSQLCSLAEICGLKDPQNPNQAYRFVSAMFIHSGFIHILFNLIVLLTLCCQIEKLIGSLAYLIVFFAGGIGGNLLGGNFGLIGQPAVGASGSIYACISLEIVDLMYNAKYEANAKTRAIVSIVFAIIGLGLGLLPGIDNFSHIGGFCLGILGGLFFAPSIHATRKHMIITWVLRLLALALLIAYFVSLPLNFYQSDDPTNTCHWCRYLSCLPVFESCNGFGT